MYRKYFSKTEKREYAEKMRAIEDFCDENGIDIAESGSCYFILNGKKYRVSNHKSIHPESYYKFNQSARIPDVDIRASRLRIVEIYNNLLNGFELDGRGNIKNK